MPGTRPRISRSTLETSTLSESKVHTAVISSLSITRWEAAALLALFLLSLAGIPPTAGFIAKILVFQAAVRAGLSGLVVVAVLASVVAAFFYIRLIVLAYMEDPHETERVRSEPAPGVALATTAAITLVLGILPGLLLDPLQSAGVLRW
jgi:NADH-quinone oxidoreductase subunit N